MAGVSQKRGYVQVPFFGRLVYNLANFVSAHEGEQIKFYIKLFGEHKFLAVEYFVPGSCLAPCESAVTATREDSDAQR